MVEPVAADPGEAESLRVSGWILPGRVDPVALLSTWIARREFYPVLWIGIAVFGVTRGVEEFDSREIDTIGEMLSSLFSPLAGIILALALRALSALSALGLAGWVASRQLHTREPDRKLSPRDRLYTARALRSIRWTRPVCEAALDRSGSARQALRLTDVSMTVLGIVGFVAMVVILALTGET
jgi:Mn2+/Fe2+ NRAMP family transporter